jgi:hypothetical protein
MPQLSNQPITQNSIERFRARAREIRAQAELTMRPELRQQLTETALAYERMADRGERFLTNAKLPS